VFWGSRLEASALPKQCRSTTVDGEMMTSLIDLFLTFMQIGMFTFGGGYAMISVVENACVENRHWITHDDMMNITVIAESTPGPIAINCATYVGYKQRGLAGAIAATVGMILPSFLVIYLISRFLDDFLEIAWIAHAFQGIKLAVGILIIDAGVKMVRQMPAKALPRVILVCSFAAMVVIEILALRVSSIALLLVAAVVSLAVYVVCGNVDKGAAV
jgi:chromate transporter